MRLLTMTCALLGAAGLAACQPAEEETTEPASSAMGSTEDTSTMAPADGTMTPADPAMSGTPPMDDTMTSPSSADGTMAPGQTPPTLPPESGTASPPAQ